MTLRTRIAAVASLAVALAVLAAATSLYLAVRSDLRGELDSSLRSRARAFTSAPGAGGGDGRPAGHGAPGPPPQGGPFPPADGGSGGLDRFPGSVQPAPFGGASGYVELLTASGRVIVPGGQGAGSTPIPASVADRRIAAAGAGTSFSDRSVKGTRLRVLTLGTGGGTAVLIARPLTEVERELSRLLTILALIGGGGIVLAAIIGGLVARTALTPIASFTRDTEDVSGKLDLSRRLEVRGRDELARLAESFNGTLDALERSVGAQRQLVADASHELRTPIASLRANVQVLGEAERLPVGEQEALRRDVVAELDELTALVADLVELARGGEGEQAAEPEDVRLDELVEVAVRSARRRGQTRFELSLEPTVVSGRAERIARAVSNLIDNARKWSPPDGVVEIALRDGVLSVRDHGPGFQEADLPFVFERFYRAQGTRRMPGSGLGLAIVRQTAEAGGGFAQAANAPGGGALLLVRFDAVV